jgi:hypothetical protein
MIGIRKNKMNDVSIKRGGEAMTTFIAEMLCISGHHLTYCLPYVELKDIPVALQTLITLDNTS